MVGLHHQLNEHEFEYRLKVKGWKKIFHANGDQKKAGIAILISGRIDFKTKAVCWHVEPREARWVGGVQRRGGLVLTPMKGMNF